MSDINELDATILAVKDSTNLPLIGSMTFQKVNDNSFKTMMGTTVRQAVDKMVSRNCSVVGTNCGSGIKEMLWVVEEIYQQLKQDESFIIAQPNAGKPEVR